MKLSVCLLLFTIVLNFTNLYAQSNTDKKVTIEGKTYLLHQVQKGETMYSLGKKFNMGNQELISANPELKSGLKSGSTVKIPVGQSNSEKNKKFTTHVVEKKQTIFNITKKYKITNEELLRYNPEVKNGLTIGQVLKIPLNKSASAKTEPGTPVNPETIAPKQEYKQTLRASSSPVFIHRVEPGETLFELEKRYGVSADTIKSLNPSLNENLVTGTALTIPTMNIPEITSQPVNESEFIKHVVGQGETIYSIASKFKVKIRELRETNPELKYRDMINGETLWIPNKKLITKIFDENAKDTVIVSPAYTVKHTYKNLPKASDPDPSCRSKTYQVALMLPLYLLTNDTINRVADEEQDTVYYINREVPKENQAIRKGKTVFPRSENFVHFYEGALIALDKMRKEGMKVELFIFDTEQSQHKTDSLLQLDVFREMDLIIGPVYPNLQKNVSAFSAKNRIPMVSPLSSEEQFENQNPYYFKVNPTKEYLIKETANLITNEYYDKNLIVFETGEYAQLPEARFVSLCREKINFTGYYKKPMKPLFHKYQFKENGLSRIHEVLSPDDENVFIIPAIAEGQVSTAVSNLNTLVDSSKVTLVGLSNFKRYQSIQQEYFHRTNLKYLIQYFIDYKAKPVYQFVSEFKNQFSTEPNEFSFQGYDIAYYFLSALYNYGKGFPAHISNYKLELTQLNLDFQKVSKTGGYMNYGLFEIGYEKDFSIKNYGKYGSNNLLPAK